MAEYQHQTVLCGGGTLDLSRDPAAIAPQDYSRLTNVVRESDGALTPRLGMTELQDLSDYGAEVHSAVRIWKQFGGDGAPAGVVTYKWLVGIDDVLVMGGGSAEAAWAQIADGFSGNPLTFVAYRPERSGKTWIIVGDGNKMVKVDWDGTVADIGLTAPTSALVTVIASDLETEIDKCESATAWVENEVSAALATADVAAVDSDAKQGAYSVKFATTLVGDSAYTCYWCKPVSLDLSVVGWDPESQVEASDDDHIHLWLKADDPQYIQEIRIYFVVSDNFDDATIPGTADALSTDAYLKIFRPASTTALIGLGAYARSVAEDVIALRNTTDALNVTSRQATTAKQRLRLEQEEEARLSAVPTLAPGRKEWTEFGITGIPLRRGSFIRIGNDEERDWSTITGIVVLVRTKAAEAVTVWLDDVYLRGGYAPDTSEVGSVPYDYRAINYHILTGEKSNPSPIQDEDDWLDPIRQAVRCFPEAYGDSNVRQRVYRRGGTLVSDWYLVGQNYEDGGCLRDVYADQEIQLSAILETDNDQPITTKDSTGAEVTAQPLPVLWGPLNYIIFGCRDPYRKGHLYWCKAGEFGSWPAANFYDVCAPDEELMGGFVFGYQAYVFSRARLYNIIPQITQTTNVTVVPTLCERGLLVQGVFCVTPSGVFFLSRDGIYAWAGQDATNVSDQFIRSLFTGVTRNGYYPIDFTNLRALRLTFHGTDLWFQYADTAGNICHVIYNVTDKYWRVAQFGYPVSALVSAATHGQETVGAQQLVLGGANTGKLYEHSGTSDDGAAISGTIRTGILNQSLPRNRKSYGDVAIEADRQSVNLTRTLRFESETVTKTGTITTAGRLIHYSNDAIVGQMARDVSVEVTWSSDTYRPKVYWFDLSYIPHPDITIERPTDYEHHGRLHDKMVKALEIECDTFNVARSFNVVADGTTQATITITANGRQVLLFSFTQFRARMLRLVPNSDANPWILYNMRWIFDEEPLALTRFETQYQALAAGYHSPYQAIITLCSSGTVTLTVYYLQQDGTASSDAYTISTTGGAKQTRYVSLNARKGVLFKYVLTASAAFWLYRSESSILMLVWGGEATRVHPFGDDDLDRTRQLSAATPPVQRSGMAE